jgi:hypothetical protein
MAELGVRSGGCLCGAARFTARPKPEMGVCHCGQCRKWSGGVFMAVQVAGLSVENPEALSYYVSSDYAERGFCRTCGTSLIWRLRDGSQDYVSLPALDDQTGVVFDEQIFIDEKPAIYDFANTTKTMTGAEFAVAFGREESSGG